MCPECARGQMVTAKLRPPLPSCWQPLERNSVVAISSTTTVLFTANACRVRLSGRHCAKGFTYIISMNPDNHFVRYLSRVLIFWWRNWAQERLSALPSGSQLGNGIVKIGILAPEPEALITVFKSLDLPLSSGLGPNTSIIHALPNSLYAQTNQTNALPLMRQDSKPWHMLPLGTLSYCWVSARRILCSDLTAAPAPAQLPPESLLTHYPGNCGPSLLPDNTLSHVFMSVSPIWPLSSLRMGFFMKKKFLVLCSCCQEIVTCRSFLNFHMKSNDRQLQK